MYVHEAQTFMTALVGIEAALLFLHACSSLSDSQRFHALSSGGSLRRNKHVADVYR
jgi:hypothetical protein